MLNKSLFVLTSVLLLSLITACTWVKLSTEGHDVSVVSEDEVKDCKLKGQTTVNLKSTIAGLDRSRKKVKLELRTLARNSAVNIGGDTVVPASEIKKGKQTFNVYVCGASKKN